MRLTVAAALLIVMALGAFVVTGDNWVTRADLDVVRALNADETPLVSHLGRFVTQFGSLLTLALLAVSFAVASWSHGRQNLDSALPALALIAAAILDPLAKLVVGRPRPPKALAQVLETSTGYPSGHSAQSAAFFLTVAFLMARRSTHPGRWLAAALIAAGLVGTSRVVLGVHSPTDVLGGWCLGAACALVLSVVAARVRDRR